MKRSFELFVTVLAMLTIAGEAASTQSKLDNFYYNTEPTEAPMHQAHNSASDDDARPNEGLPESYQKYVACAPRSFFFKACTLCFCTDSPSLAICWDYEGVRCAETRRLVELQLDAHNNDPNGVW